MALWEEKPVAICWMSIGEELAAVCLACEVADVQAKIWNALEAGQEQQATEMFNKIITLLNFEYLYGAALYKEVLKERGVIRYSTFRQCGTMGLDQVDMVEFKRIMDYVRPMFSL